ncbi:hypothetical protein C5167_051101 [Papaver somniferum]|uniref:Uncharacterized protein n=1 Tax=Papaver somniferum TaxID=3469 RepID=A0A4Y7KT91_PAPSO|nr:hypothetical protein C5167_051101 [Papaver somniferum]
MNNVVNFFEEEKATRKGEMKMVLRWWLVQNLGISMGRRRDFAATEKSMHLLEKWVVGGDVQLVTEQVGGCSWSWEKFGSISIEAVVVVLQGDGVFEGKMFALPVLDHL